MVSIARGAVAQRLSPGTEFGVFAVGVDLGATALLRSLSNESKIAARELTVAGKGINLFNSALKASVVTTGIALVGIAGAVQITSEFRDELVLTAAILDEDITTVMDTVGKSAIELSTRFGRSATDIQSAARQLGQAGFSLEEVDTALEPLLQFVIATGSDIPDAVDLATKVLRGFKLEIEEIDHVFNTFMVALNRSPATIDDLKFAFRQVTPIAGQLGISLESTAAAIAAVTRAGLSGETAGTSFATGLQKILDPAEQSTAEMKKLIAVFKEAIQQTGDVSISLDAFLKAAFGQGSGIDSFQKSIQQLKEEANIASFAEESDAAIEALAERFEGIDLIVELFTVKSSKFWLDYLANATEARLETIAMQLELSNTEDAAEKALQSISVQFANLRNNLAAPLLSSSFAEEIVDVLERVNDSGDLDQLGQVFADFAVESLRTLGASLKDIIPLLSALSEGIGGISIAFRLFAGVLGPTLQLLNKLPGDVIGTAAAAFTLYKIIGPLAISFGVLAKSAGAAAVAQLNFSDILDNKVGKALLRTRIQANLYNIAIGGGIVGLTLYATGNEKLGLAILGVSGALVVARVAMLAYSSAALAAAFGSAALAATVTGGIAAVGIIAGIAVLTAAFKDLDTQIEQTDVTTNRLSQTLKELPKRAEDLRSLADSIAGIEKNLALSTDKLEVFDVGKDGSILFDPEKDEDLLDKTQKLIESANKLDTTGPDVDFSKLFFGDFDEQIEESKNLLQSKLLEPEEIDLILAQAFGEELGRSVGSGLERGLDISNLVITTQLAELTRNGIQTINNLINQAIGAGQVRLGNEIFTSEQLAALRQGTASQEEKVRLEQAVKGTQFNTIQTATFQAARDIEVSAGNFKDDLEAFSQGLDKMSASVDDLIAAFEGVQIVNGKYETTMSLLTAAGIDATKSLEELKKIKENMEKLEFVNSLTELFKTAQKDVPNGLKLLRETLLQSTLDMAQGFSDIFEGTQVVALSLEEQAKVNELIAQRAFFLTLGPSALGFIAAIDTELAKISIDAQQAADSNIFTLLSDSGGFNDFIKIGALNSFTDATTDMVDSIRVGTEAFYDMQAAGLDVAGALEEFAEFTLRNRMFEITNQLISLFNEFGTGVPQEFTDLRLTIANQMLQVGKNLVDIFNPDQFDAASLVEIWAKALETPHFEQNNNIIVRISSASGTDDAVALGDQIVKNLANRGVTGR